MADPRRPKPTRTKQLQGNPGKRKLNGAEPKPGGRPTRPIWLVGEARKEWERLAGRLHTCGILTAVDRSILAAYCVAWASYVEAVEALREGALVQVTATGYESPSAWWVIRRNAAAEVAKLGAELGLTPSSRSRLTVPEKPAEDPYADFRGRRGHGKLHAIEGGAASSPPADPTRRR